MNVLLHVCCGPCSIVPLKGLAGEGASAKVFYFNPNIHPYKEWEKRLETLNEHLERTGTDSLPVPSYEVREWFRQVAYREEVRCRLCYHQRLFETARRAKKGRFDSFTSTLLYSRFQKHEVIKEVGEAVAEEVGVPFLYRDWRENWAEGVEESRALGMYRQQYCGCLYSEIERFSPPQKKKRQGGNGKGEIKE